MPARERVVLRRAARLLDWFGWHVLGGIPTGYRKPAIWLLRFGPYRWGMALCNRTWLRYP